eukprot:10348284-Lingulodinium_polyedra.AAC.1
MLREQQCHTDGGWGAVKSRALRAHLLHARAYDIFPTIPGINKHIFANAISGTPPPRNDQTETQLAHAQC